MISLKDIVFLMTTVLLWLTYSTLVQNPDYQQSQWLEYSWTISLLFTSILVIRSVTFLILNIIVERIWQVKSTELMRFLIYMLLGIITMTVVLRFGFDFNIAALLTTSALLTAILGFGLQSTLSGFFAGLALQLERHLKPGDNVCIDGQQAIVVNLGWRSITVRRPDTNNFLVIPNSHMAENAFEVYPHDRPVRSEFFYAAPLSTPAQQIIDVITEVIRNVPKIAPNTRIIVEPATVEAENNHLNYRIRYYALSRQKDFSICRPIIQTRLWYAFQRNRIILPQSSHNTPSPPEKRYYPETKNQRRARLPELVSLLSSLPACTGMSVNQIESWILKGRNLLYAPDEKIECPRGIVQSLVVVCAGMVRMEIHSQTQHFLDEWRAKNPAPLETHIWKEGTLQEVSEQLTLYIGPYAHQQVQEYAQRMPDLYHLYHALAKLIQQDEDRQAFLVNTPAHPFRDFGIGFNLETTSDGQGKWQMPVEIAALQEVELLVLPLEAISFSG